MSVERLLPVIVSIFIIIGIAILREYSKTMAAIIAVMPINIPLGMWIIYAGSDDKQAAMVEFNSALFINILPTLVFMLVAWQAAKAGWELVPIIAVSYIAWGIGLGFLFGIRALLG